MPNFQPSAELLSAGSEMAKAALKEGSSLAGKAGEWAVHNPRIAAATATVGLVVALPGALVAPVLSLAGYGPGGVQAASIAAGAQSAIGNVVGGSVFATLQSAGAGGAGYAIVTGATQVGAAVIGAAGAGAAWAWAKL
ncbi:hypothetical protein BJY04DRAFT_189096 [Aspergillus karnatakaensis]|uniref:uncharacterized protein n=1 Tax=Aspergillus karnatakaensis TaxID=1810916 RepID=UPI003CCD667D